MDLVDLGELAQCLEFVDILQHSLYLTFYSVVADDVSRGLQLFFFLFVIDDGKLLFDFSVVCKHCVPHFLRICLRVVAGHRVIFGRNRFEKFGPCDHCFATKVSQKLLVDHL